VLSSISSDHPGLFRLNAITAKLYTSMNRQNDVRLFTVNRGDFIGDFLRSAVVRRQYKAKWSG
jgi:hypothetical protein